MNEKEPQSVISALEQVVNRLQENEGSFQWECIEYPENLNSENASEKFAFVLSPQIPTINPNELNTQFDSLVNGLPQLFPKNKAEVASVNKLSYSGLVLIPPYTVLSEFSKEISITRSIPNPELLRNIGLDKTANRLKTQTKTLSRLISITLFPTRTIAIIAAETHREFIETKSTTHFYLINDLDPVIPYEFIEDFLQKPASNGRIVDFTERRNTRETT